jgi:hypothetical protein
MAKWVLLTARKLKPGTYDDWRKAWDPADSEVDMPSGAKAYICRNVNDENEILAFGMLEATSEELEAMRPSGEAEEARKAGMAPFIESISTDGLYEVIDEVSG